MTVLRTERLAQDLTLDWVAKKVGVTHQSIQIFETSREGKVPTETTLRKWLRALELPEDWADAWMDWRVEEEVAEVLTKLRGPRALPAEDVDAIRRSVRNSLRARR